MKRMIRASQILPNKQIQEGMWWDDYGHEFEVTQLLPNNRCEVTETWINEDTGRRVRRKYTFKIGQDDTGIQYAYKGDFKLYSTSAFNYPYDETSSYDDDSYYEDDHYTPSSTAGDYSPSNPWDAPGMSVSDFI